MYSNPGSTVPGLVRDPEFAAKAAWVLDLYAGIWDGQPAGQPRLRHLLR